MARIKQGGDVGKGLVVTCTPHADLNAVIDAYSDKRDAIGKLVTIAANYVVTLAADDAVPNGQIVGIQGNETNDYVLEVELWALQCQNTNVSWFCPSIIRSVPYDGTLAYGDTIQADGADGLHADDAGTSAGHGFVLMLANPTGYADVAF